MSWQWLYSKGADTNQAENVLYRLSQHSLMSGSEFFYDTFSIPNESATEGASDQHPVVLPIKSAQFNVYLLYDRE